MRFLLAVAVVLVGVSVSGTAQQSKQLNGKSSHADAAPKSMPAVKAPGATTTSSTSKELRNVERESSKGTGSAHVGKKAPKAVALTPQKDNRNPPMNFGGKGNAGSVGTSKQANPYKGRLKQKGSGGHS